MTWTLVEPCAGSAAFTFHLLGARQALLPYQGSKWRVRRQLQAVAARLGFPGSPSHVFLTDPGPWGRALPMVFEDKLRIVGLLKKMAERDPAEVYSGLHGAAVPTDPARYAAEYLFLQRLAFSGKAVSAAGGAWWSPGFNRTSAYGTAATARFGAVHPMIPSLIRTLQQYEVQLRPVPVRACQQLAQPPAAQVATRTLVYLDPPYKESTRYPDGDMTRDQVVTLAEAWREAGATVVVSEQHGLDMPAGWVRERLWCGRQDTSPFRGKQEEWITWAAPGARTYDNK